VTQKFALRNSDTYTCERSLIDHERKWRKIRLLSGAPANSRRDTTDRCWNTRFVATVMQSVCLRCPRICCAARPPALHGGAIILSQWNNLSQLSISAAAASCCSRISARQLPSTWYDGKMSRYNSSCVPVPSSGRHSGHRHRDADGGPNEEAKRRTTHFLVTKTIAFSTHNPLEQAKNPAVL